MKTPGAGVTLRFTYERQDLAHATRANFGSQSRLRFNAIAAAGLIALGIWLRTDEASRGLGLAGIIVGAGFITLLAVMWLFGPDIALWRDPKYRAPYDLTFSDDGIHFRTANIDSHLQWSIYSHALQHPNGYLLYHGPNAYTILPARVFANAAERTTFDALLAAHVPRLERR